MKTPRGPSASDAHERAAGAESLAERRDASIRLLPDLAREVIAMMRDRIRVVELVGGVVAGPGRQLSRALDHVVNVLRSHAPPTFDRLHDVDLRAEGADQLEALLREAVGHHDQTAVSLGAAHECERRACAPARVFDDRVVRSERAVTLRALDHRERHPVLHRARRIAVLELQPQLRAVRRRAARQPDERCVPDRVEHRGHAGSDRRRGRAVDATPALRLEITPALRLDRDG
jgi:hypothetical protein